MSSAKTTIIGRRRFASARSMLYLKPNPSEAKFLSPVISVFPSRKKCINSLNFVQTKDLIRLVTKFVSLELGNSITRLKPGFHMVLVDRGGSDSF